MRGRKGAGGHRFSTFELGGFTAFVFFRWVFLPQTPPPHFPPPSGQFSRQAASAEAECFCLAADLSAHLSLRTSTQTHQQNVPRGGRAGWLARKTHN